MADITKEEQERMTAVVTLCADRMRLAHSSADEAAKAFTALAEAARKVELPPIPEVARMRMARMADEHGLFRFMLPAWWRWWWIMVRPNDRVGGRDAASSRRVPSHDGLCPDGGETR